MFWSNWSIGSEKHGSIERAWMDGTNRVNWVENLGWPIGLTIDYGKFYVIEMLHKCFNIIKNQN